MSNPKKVDTKWEAIAIFLSFLRTNWWKFCAVAFVVGMVLSGFTIKGKNFQCEKEPIKLNEVNK